MSVEDLGDIAETVGRRGFWAAGGARVGLAVLLFSLGLICGIPLALFSLDLIVNNALTIFAVLFGFLLVAALVTAVIIAFRRPLLRTVLKRSEIEMERFARPLADVARFAAEQKVQEATEAAREVGELMLARFAWVSTRRWMVATITAFVAAIAALSGSVLLLQQNQLLQQQTDRIVEQNALLAQQIELGEAQRSTSIVPEILDIGDLVGTEVAKLAEDGRDSTIFFDSELSAGLRARIIAASLAARPYRYLDSSLSRAGDAELNALALDRRTDIPAATKAIARWREHAAAIEQPDPDVAGERLIDRPVSPERGQLLTLLFNLGVMRTEALSYFGADFSFAEMHLPSFGVMSLHHALLRFADFSRAQIGAGEFGAAYLEQARFRNAVIGNSHFSGLTSDQLILPFKPEEDVPVWYTQMAGADFAGATVYDSDFRDVHAVGARFDYALLHNIDFSRSSLSAATFRNAVLNDLVLDDTDLNKIELDGAFVFAEDFLDTLADGAAPGSFDRDLYRLEPVDRAVLEDSSPSLQLWQIPGYPDSVPKVWRIAR